MNFSHRLQTAKTLSFGVLLGVFNTDCGALGAPARGDRDLPASLFSGYAMLNNGTSPTASPALITADGDVSIDEPTVVHIASKRIVYVTVRGADGRSKIGRCPERTDGQLDFTTVTPVFESSAEWEGANVSGPALIVDATTGQIAMFYAANGSIGLARSADGVQWQRSAVPVLQADAARGESTGLRAPSVAVDSSRTFWMAFESNGAIAMARASAVEGPWSRVGSGSIATASNVAVSVGTLTSPATSLTDPALTITTSPAGRTLFVLAAGVRTGPPGVGARLPTVVMGWASADGIVFTRAERSLFVDRAAAIRPGAFERIDDRTSLLWVTREAGGTTIVGALISPPGQRIGTQLMR